MTLQRGHRVQALGHILPGHRLFGGESSAFVPDFYVDSVNGNDSNDGTEESPYQTLSKAEIEAAGVGSGVKIGLVAGSYWRESLDLSSLSSVQVQKVGSGDDPVIDGADVVSSWSAEGNPNVWEASVAHDATATSRLTIYEDDLLMDRLEGLSSSLVAGQFLDIKGSDGTPLDAIIYATDSGNPNSNGSTYEVSTRSTCVLLGADSTIAGVTTKRAISNNGSIETGTGANAARVLAADGTKHNFFLASGSAKDCIVFGADDVTSYEPVNTMFVSYMDDPTGEEWIYERCFGYGLGGFLLFGYSHSAGVETYDSGTLRQCAVIGEAFPGHFGGALAANALTEGCYWNARTGGLNFGMQRYNQEYNGITYGAGAGGVLEISASHCVSYFEPRTPSAIFTACYQIDSNAPRSFDNCVFSGGTGSYDTLLNSTGAAAGALDINNSIFWGFGEQLKVLAAQTYTGDYNVFMADNVFDSGRAFSSTFEGVLQTTLAAWQTATGEDANSVYLDKTEQSRGVSTAFWLGVANDENDGPVDGDFRINPSAKVYGGDGTAYTGTFADGTTPITDAGPQNHWDWNARALASGPPVEWPDVPANLTDARTYVSDPEAWDFAA